MKKGKDLTEKSSKKSSPSVLRSALSMATGTLSSRVLGLLRDVLLAAFFTKTITDVFFAAYKLPNMFRRILGEGSLSVSFIPVYIELMQKSGEESSKKLAGSIWTLLLVVTSVLSLFGIIFMDQFLPWVLDGKGFTSVPGKVELAVHLGRIIFFYLFLVTNYAFIMAILNAHKYFLIPAMGPTLYNLVFIGFILFSGLIGQVDGVLISIGVLVGGLFQVFLVFGLLVKIKKIPKLSFDFGVEGFATVIKNMGPGMVGFGVVQIMSFANVKLAASLPEGVVSYMYYGDRLLELPQSIIAISLGSALLPTLSKLWAEGKKGEFLEQTFIYQRILLFLALPCCVGLYVLAEPMVDVLFGRGQFTGQDIALTAGILKIYSLLLLASSLNKVLIPNIYAIKNTWIPAVVSVFSITFHILFAYYYMLPKWGLDGLIWSMTISGFLNMTLIFICCQLIVGRTGVLKLFLVFSKLLVMALVMGLVVFYGYEWIEEHLLIGGMTKYLRLFLAIGLGAVIYLGLAWVFKIYEFRQTLRLLRRKN